MQSYNLLHPHSPLHFVFQLPFIALHPSTHRHPSTTIVTIICSPSSSAQFFHFSPTDSHTVFASILVKLNCSGELDPASKNARLKSIINKAGGVAKQCASIHPFPAMFHARSDNPYVSAINTRPFSYSRREEICLDGKLFSTSAPVKGPGSFSLSKRKREMAVDK